MEAREASRDDIPENGACRGDANSATMTLRLYTVMRSGA